MNLAISYALGPLVLVLLIWGVTLFVLYLLIRTAVEHGVSRALRSRDGERSRPGPLE